MSDVAEIVWPKGFTAVQEQYHHFPGTTVTVCCLQLPNNFTVTGVSTTAVDSMFDAQVGRDLARKQAVDALWVLAAYEERKRQHADRVIPAKQA